MQTLFEGNRRWAQRTVDKDPGFFNRLLEQQSPRYLWIGCADSRVPANEIVDLMPGEIFVHRNVANVVVHSDLNCLSVMQFAVDLLQVRHVLVVGHYGCGGVKAAMLGTRIGLADNWLRHVQDVRERHHVWLNAIADENLRHEAMCELNVLEQALHVCQTTVMQDAWSRGQSVVVHGLVYGLHDGLLQDMRMTAAGAEDVSAAYGLALGAIKERYEKRRREVPAAPPA